MASENSRSVRAALISLTAVVNLCRIHRSARDSLLLLDPEAYGVKESSSFPRTYLVAW